MSESNQVGRDGSRSLKPSASRNACASRDASASRFIGGLRIAVAGLLLGATLVASAPASAQQPVRIDLVDGFGTSHHAFVIAEVRNQTNQLLQGHVEISVSGWSTSNARYRLPADLPPQSTRNFQFELPPVEGSVEARFVSGGSEYGRWQDGWGGSGQPVIVVIAERANVRSTLSALEGTEITDYGSTRQVNYDVGRVSFDGSGDPIAPRTLAGWRGVSMVTATTRDLQRLSPEQLDALYEYVWTGGRLVLSQSAPEDMAAESVRRFVGDLRPGIDPRGDATWQSEAFGGARSVGFGVAWYVERDLDSPTVAADTDTQQILSEMLAMSAPVLSRPQARFFQAERANTYGGGNELAFDALRSSLDPNESFRPALGFVAIVLFLYIFLVGPINFGYVKKRGKPTLALMTTPLIALGCLAVMLLVGYIGKGITMRYRSVALIETVAESTVAQQRTYRGLFSTRPTNYDIPAGGYSTIVGNQRELLQDQSPERRGSIEDIRSSLWETVFVREERMVDMGRGIRFEGGTDGSVTGVVNGSGVAIHSALIVSPSGQVYEVGELPAGGRAVVASSPTFVLRSQYGTMNAMDHEALHRALGFGEDEEEMFEGLLSLTSGAASQTPTLYGRVDPVGGAYAIFAEERSLALLRVQMATPPVGGFSQLGSQPAFSEDMDPLMLLQPEETP